jgi:hypothetical protein
MMEESREGKREKERRRGTCKWGETRKAMERDAGGKATKRKGFKKPLGERGKGRTQGKTRRRRRGRLGIGIGIR